MKPNGSAARRLKECGKAQALADSEVPAVA
jgi:hypothetical protein